MNKKTIYKVLSVILVIAWMILVFALSNEVADDSSRTSGRVIRMILKIFEPNVAEDVLVQQVAILQPVVRKLAHFTLYMLGGILIHNLINIYVKEKTQILSCLCGCFYAVTDEIHQLYVVGRSGELRDVAIDTAGVFLGVFIIYLLMCIKGDLISKKKN